MLEHRQVVTYPACVNTCISNVNSMAASFGCSAGDTLCLCRYANFGYAIRDCAAAICDPADAAEAVSYVIDSCAGAAAVASSAGSSVSSLAATATSSSILSGTAKTGTSTLQLTNPSTSPTTYTTYTTTIINTVLVSGELTGSTFTYVQTVTDSSVFAGLQQQTLSTTSTSTATASVAQTTANSGGDGDSGGGLTTGAKIGIGVGVPLGVLFVLGTAAILFWRSRRRRRQQGVLNAEPNTYGRKAELHNENLARTHGRSELSERRAPVELDATGQTREHGPVAELRTDVTNADSATQSSKVGQEMSERHILS